MGRPAGRSMSMSEVKQRDHQADHMLHEFPLWTNLRERWRSRPYHVSQMPTKVEPGWRRHYPPDLPAKSHRAPAKNSDLRATDSYRLSRFEARVGFRSPNHT